MVEVLVAGTVMLFAITSSILSLQYALRTVDTARYTTLAGQILQSQMEKLRLLTWSQLTDATNGAVASTTFTTDVSENSEAHLNRFTLSQSIVDAASPFSSQMKVITLTATWKGIDGRSHTLSYITRYAQNGISDFFYTAH